METLDEFLLSKNSIHKLLLFFSIQTFETKLNIDFSFKQQFGKSWKWSGNIALFTSWFRPGQHQRPTHQRRYVLRHRADSAPWNVQGTLPIWRWDQTWSLETCNFKTSLPTATSEGSIPMAEGEELHVIELDQGDGWTRVRRIMSGNVVEEGFVPTSYIESTLYA